MLVVHMEGSVAQLFGDVAQKNVFGNRGAARSLHQDSLSCRQLGNHIQKKVPPIDNLVAAKTVACGPAPELLPAAPT
jgi:hypothetical protein